MTEFKKVALSNALVQYKESAVENELSSFSCNLNMDIENFLKNKAINFARQNIAPTTLVYAKDADGWHLCGYYTITIKTIDFEKKTLGANMFTKVKKFGTYDKDVQKCTVPVPLIAQLGKNFTNDYNKLIKGDDLLEMACSEVRAAERIIGGKMVYAECEDVSKLMDFYKKNGFSEFSRRSLDKDEKDSFKAQYLVQMLKYLK